MTFLDILGPAGDTEHSRTAPARPPALGPGMGALVGQLAASPCSVENLPCLFLQTPKAAPVLMLGKSHGWRNLVGCSPWGHEESDTAERLDFYFSLFMHWRRKWQPTPVFLPGESQGWGNLVGCCHTESDMTEVT